MHGTVCVWKVSPSHNTGPLLGVLVILDHRARPPLVHTADVVELTVVLLPWHWYSMQLSNSLGLLTVRNSLHLTSWPLVCL